MSQPGQILSIDIGNSLEALDALNAELAMYEQLSGKTNIEVVQKKGYDLGIKLFQGFWVLRTQRSKAPWSGPMFRAAKARGWRTIFSRKNYGKHYENPYAITDEPYRSIWESGRNARLKRGEKGKVDMSRRRRSRRGLAVAQELSRRQRGAGLLGVSFLTLRRGGAINKQRRNAAFVVNNTSRKLGLLSHVESGSGADGSAFFRIVNYTPGVDTIGMKRGIFATAINQVRADTQVYLVRKQMEALRKSLGKT
ncbi:hypothetical protein OpiT1DRAFT_01300 [Opitutaceae bacterium TAV1]|nr:hypothetical protein OpiT1DRAFT_01300 [Opitutaceae bacterium TAV1]